MHWDHRSPTEAASDGTGIRGFLIFGDSDHHDGLQVARTYDLLNYEVDPSLLLLPPRPRGWWDSALVEAGPPPVKLSTGDYLMVYNAAEDTGPSERPGYSYTYRAGWALLSGSQPPTVLSRSVRPALEPELWWETGGEGAPPGQPPVLVPNVTFVQGMVPVRGQQV